MTDMEFYILYNKISKCKNVSDKADMIIKSISSPGDFLDVLNAQCLYGREYLVLYKKLLSETPETIAFLIKVILSGTTIYDFDEFDINIKDIESFMNNHDNINIDKISEEWQKYLTIFISKLTGEERSIIVESLIS